MKSVYLFLALVFLGFAPLPARAAESGAAFDRMSAYADMTGGSNSLSYPLRLSPYLLRHPRAGGDPAQTTKDFQHRL